LSNDGAIGIAKGLSNNCSINSINLSMFFNLFIGENKIGDEGVIELAKALETNKEVTVLLLGRK